MKEKLCYQIRVTEASGLLSLRAAAAAAEETILNDAPCEKKQTNKKKQNNTRQIKRGSICIFMIQKEKRQTLFTQ